MGPWGPVGPVGPMPEGTGGGQGGQGGQGGTGGQGQEGITLAPQPMGADGIVTLQPTGDVSTGMMPLPHPSTG